MMRWQSFKAGLLGLIGVSVAGCVSVLPEPAVPDALYAIDAPGARQPLVASLIIREPEAPQIVAGRVLASVDASGAIRLVPSVEWAGRSTRLLQLALVDSFSIDGAGTAVLPETGVAARYELSSRIQTFELRGEQAVCEISVSVISTFGNTLIRQGEVSVSQPAVSMAASDRAGALKAAAEQCVAEVAAFAAGVVETREAG